MDLFAARALPLGLPMLAAAAFVCLLSPGFAAEEADAPKGAAVTVNKVAKSCFPNIVEASGTVRPRAETAVRPDRFGLKVAEVLADAGDTVTAGQTLARLTPPAGGAREGQGPVGGRGTKSTAIVGAVASGKGEPLFTILARNEFDLIGT